MSEDSPFYQKNHMEQITEQKEQTRPNQLQSLAIICSILMAGVAPYAILFGLTVPIYSWTRVLYFFDALVILPFFSVFGLVCSLQLHWRNVWRAFAVVLGISSIGICVFVLWQWIKLDLQFSGRIVAPEPWKAVLGGAAIALATFLVAIRFMGSYPRNLLVRAVLFLSSLCVAVGSFHAFQFMPRFIDRNEQLLSLKRYPAEAMVGAQAPDFSLKTIRGSTFHLEDNKGKVILLDFWATWCGPCLAELPHLEAIHRELKDTSAIVLAVSIDVDTAKVKPFVDSLRYTFTTLYGNQKLSGLYRLQNIPTSFIIDKNGIVREVLVGYYEKTFPHLKNLMQRYLE